jgi:hypothetical protein
MFDTWVVDVSNRDFYCFVPYNRETGMLVTGMNIITDKCPGKLIGVIHRDGGQAAVEQWIAAHLNWQSDLSSESATDAAEMIR